MRLAFGYSSAHFLGANSATSVRHANAWIAVLGYPDISLDTILPLLEAVARSGRPIAFFCSEVPALLRETLIVNNQQQTLRCVVIDAPSAADYDQAQIFLLAAATGARIVASNRMLAQTTLNMLGEADLVTVDAVSTVLSGFPLLRPA